MSASNSDPQGRRLVGHGVAVAVHVSRRGARWPGAIGCLPQNRSDAPSSRPRGRQ